MEFIIYLLKVNTAIVLFYGIFRFLFRMDTFFQWKRLALLAIILICFAYPAISLTQQVIASHQLKNILETVYIPVYTLPEVVITENANTPVNLFLQIALTAYFLVSVLLFVRLLFQIGTTFYKLYHTDKNELLGQTVYESPGLKTPFSFFRWIVLDSPQYSGAELYEILMHETTHVEQGHSVDTILAELVCIVCWFNPFAWLLKTEIRMNLEFLADRSVLNSGYGAEHYQFHLLRLSYHKAAAKITNNFNVSLLKKRIFMMNKKQTPHRSMWKYTSILPVVAMLLLFNSTFQIKAEKSNETKSTQHDPVDIVQNMPHPVPVNETNDVKQTPVKAQDKPVIKASGTKQVFNHVDQMPQFPGGEVMLMRWLIENIIYPKEAAEKGVQGRVNLRFIVKTDGSIEDIEVIKSLDPHCDKEALRALKEMPKWIPGKQNGVAVNVYYTLPVLFRLQNNSSTPVNQNSLDLIIEIDGKIASAEEMNKLNPGDIESFKVNKDLMPPRIIIKTKK